jgi:hypothetical protein
MLANISAQEKAIELTLPASNYFSFHPSMGRRVQSVSSSSLALGFRDQSLVQTVGLP